MHLFLVVTLFVNLLSSPAFGENQIYELTCESDANRYRACGLHRFVSRVVLLDEYSSGRCVSGQTFGFKGKSIWVSKGCRGHFRVHLK